MARNFTQSVPHYLDHGSAIVSGTPCTFSCWARPDTDSSSLYRRLVAVTDSASGDALTLYQRKDDIGAQHYDGSSGIAETTSLITTNNWHFCAAVFTSDSSRASWVDTTKTTNSDAMSALTGLDATSIGCMDWGGYSSSFGFGGDLAEVGIWNVALSDDEVRALAAGAAPILVRPNSLLAYVPITGRASPEIDIVGSAWTVSGATVAPHPRILEGSNTWVPFPPPAGAPSTFEPFYAHGAMRTLQPGFTG